MMLEKSDLSARVPEDHRYVWVTGRLYGSEEPERGIGWYDGSNWVTQSGSRIFDVTYWEELSEEERCKYGD